MIANECYQILKNRKEKKMLKEMFKEVENMLEINENKTKQVLELKQEVISLNEQLKTKYSSSKYLLINIENLESLRDELEEAKSSASNCEDEISNIEYAEVQSVCSYISDARSTADCCYDEISSSIRKVETMSEEAEAVEEKKVTAKKTPAKKRINESEIDDLKDKIFGNDNNQ
jgi:hypothetical protein